MEILNSINGKKSPAISGQSIDHLSVHSKELTRKIPRSQREDLDMAIATAKEAMSSWKKWDAIQRANLLEKIGHRILENAEELARLDVLDTGKTLSFATQVDVPRSAENFFYFARALRQLNSPSSFNNKAYNLTTRFPLGIVGLIVPWNLPLYLLTWKLAPALAMGNCVVAKPSELSPSSATLLADLIGQLNCPQGIFSLLHGKGEEIGREIVAHPDIKAISFTGGTETGQEIASLAASHQKKISLELGGKNPLIVFDSAKIEEVTDMAIRSSFGNQGQICLATSRHLVHESIYDQYKSALIRKMNQLKTGDPFDRHTQFGLVIGPDHRRKIEQFVELTDSSNITASTLKSSSTCFFPPTIIENIPPEHPLNQEEIFGPVVTLCPFKSDQMAIDLANSTRFGLCASIWTSDIDQALRVAHQVDAGMIWINDWMNRDLSTPFGGVKASGLGREGGHYSFDFFSQTKNICLKVNL